MEPCLKYHLVNKPSWVVDCVITVFKDGHILLNWNGRGINGLDIRESGFLLTIRAAKMYVTKNISNGRSIWCEETII